MILSERIEQLRNVEKGGVTVSFSQYSTWVKCPSQWQRQYMLKEKKSPPTIHTTFGSAFHETLQEDLTYTHLNPAEALPLGGSLQQNLIRIYKEEKVKNDNTHYSNVDQLTEFWTQGSELLDQMQANQIHYFPNKNIELVGFEIPVYLRFWEDYNVYYNGFVDGVWRNTQKNTLLIDDYKTATKPWGYFEKKDETKPMQLMLYKEALSRLLGYPIEKIDARFLVFARTLPDVKVNRIQEYIPNMGAANMEKTLQKYRAMIVHCFNSDGTYQDEEQMTQPSKFACGYCPFKYTCKDVDSRALE